jgi:hypothetical protein
MAVRWLKNQFWARDFYDWKGWIIECDKERRRKKQEGKRRREFLISPTLFLKGG